jgi:hypothetical protein
LAKIRLRIQAVAKPNILKGWDDFLSYYIFGILITPFSVPLQMEDILFFSTKVIIHYKKNIHRFCKL